jgi:NodT family efflux transporter outer membrane factor (OMF) lipoprotein
MRPGPDRDFRPAVHVFAVVLLVSSVCASCAVGPKYRRPDVQTPPAYKEAPAQSGGVQWKPATPDGGTLRSNWWELFGDPLLNTLENMVPTSNQNVIQAEARFRQAVALVAFNRANYFPTVTTSPSFTSAGTSRNLGSANRTTGTFTNFSFPFGVSWEPDFWGRIRLTVENASAGAQANAADVANMRLSIQAELAVDYFQLLALDMQDRIFGDTITAYERALKLAMDRHNAGVASRADVVQAQTQLDTARAERTDLGVARSQFEHAIAVLTGQAPSGFSIPRGHIAEGPPEVPSGVPAELLERRPDIAAAERSVAAANAEIGLARVAYFPNIMLNAVAGLQSSSFANWLSWPSHFWSVGPSVAATILDFGRRRADVRQTQAAYEASVAEYRQTVLGAFQEVEDQFSALRLLAQEAYEQDAAVRGAVEAQRLEIERYKAGTVSYLNIITTQTIALTNQRVAVQILQRRMTASVQLIRALGGGWTAADLPSPADLRSSYVSGP